MKLNPNEPTILYVEDFEKITECYTVGRVASYIERLRNLKRPFERLSILREKKLIPDFLLWDLWRLMNVDEKFVIRNKLDHFNHLNTEQ